MTLRQTTLALLADRVTAMRGKAMDPGLRAAVVDVVLDCVTAAVAGASSRAARAARASAEASYAAGRSTLWFSGAVASRADGALLANATASMILDLDDGHRASAGHPGAAIIPACFAFAEENESRFDDLLTAIVVGYEVATRVASARDFAKLDTMSTGRWCNYGVAASGSFLRGLSSDVMCQAMAIAGVHGPNMSASRYSSVMGSHTKEGIPWSSATAAMAVTLAQDGFAGPTDILDHPDYFDARAILAHEDAPPAVTRVYFKPYSCCRWAHAALDALLGLMTERGLAASDIAAIDVATFSRALTLNNQAAPGGLEGAQFSIPFVLGLAAAQGRDALLPMSEAALSDARAVEMARKVTLSVDPALDAHFPAATPARLDLRLVSGEVLTREVIHPFGDPANPMSRAALWEKFDAATRGRDVAAVKAALVRFEQGDWRPLMAALGGMAA